MIPAQVRTLVPARLVLVPLVASLVAEVMAWQFLWAWPPSPGWYANGPLLAAVHLITVGTLSLAIVGMGWQLVPVATGVKPKAGWHTAATVINAMAIVGTLALTMSMAANAFGIIMMIGATLVFLALIARSIFVLREIFGAEGRALIRTWIVLAELCLWTGLVYGLLLLTTRMGSPLVSLNPFSGIATHASLLLIGWIGGWIVAMASILVPMFLVAPEPKASLLAVAGLLWFPGIALGWHMVWLAGALVFVIAMGLSLLRRVRRRVGSDLRVALLGILALMLVASFVLAKASVVLIALAALTVFALPVLHGVGLRIIPFLLWAYTFADNVKDAPLPEQVSAPGLSRFAAYGALAAGLLLVGGYGQDLIWIWRSGVALGGLSAAGYLGAIVVTAFRTWQAHNRLQAVSGTEAS